MTAKDIIRLRAPAKINLTLHVGPLRPDGFHGVRTLMVALDGLADTVEVSRSHRREVLCNGLNGPRNIAWTALDALESHLGSPLDPVRVRIEKKIPSPAGLGGGSSDAAAVLRATRTLLDLDLRDDDLERVAARVGSDVAFFVRGRAQWALGRGDVLEPAVAPEFTGVIVHPQTVLSTADVYATFDRLRGGKPLDGPLPDVAEWWRSRDVSNDLWHAALTMSPQLGKTARALAALGADKVLLCGSGGAMAGLWRSYDAAHAAHVRLGSLSLGVVRPQR